MAQAPALHAALAWARLQALPQLPQLAMSPVVSVSHPLATLLSQLPKPLLQVIWQAPALHAGVPLLLEQTFPQAPQCAVLALVSVSQPLATLPSQSPKPASQAIWQAPALHEGVPWLFEHALPHAPQLLTVVTSTSQPSAAFPLQSAKPGLHE